MGNSPLVTVNILSYNRKDELRNTITKVCEQDYKNIEVIVVDNASSDGSPEMVEKEFPSVKLIRMNKNVGISGWNEGFKASKGEYILVLDDDSYPENNAIMKSLQYFYDDVMVVALSVYNCSLGKYENDYFEEYPISFIGCGAIIKSSTFKIISYYSNHYFLYQNELDFSARLLNTGAHIRYAKDAVVIHIMSIKNRGYVDNSRRSAQRYYWYFISYIIFLIHNISTPNSIKLSIKWVVNRLLIAVFFNYWGYFFRALHHILINHKYYAQERKIVAYECEKLYLKMIPWVERDYFPNFHKPRFFKMTPASHLKWHFNNFLAFLVFNVLRLIFYKISNHKKGILFINTGTLGDVVITSLLLDNINILEKKDEIFLVIKKEYSDLFKDYNSKIKIVYFEQKKYKWSFTYRIKFLRQLCSYKIKLCVNLTSARGISSDEIALLSGAETVWCFHNSWRKLKKAFGKKMDSYYDRILFENVFNEYEKHYRLLELLKQKNGNYFSVSPSLNTADNLDYLKRLNLPQKYLVIAPMSSDRTRTWGAHNYQSLCQLISKRVNIILIGSERERLQIEEIKEGNDRIMNLAGKLKLDEIEMLIKRCSLFIGNDSGLSHLALKVDVPMIAIIGGGNHQRYFPFKQTDTRQFLYHTMDCFGCEWKCHLKEKFCLTRVDPFEVHKKAIQLLEAV